MKAKCDAHIVELPITTPYGQFVAHYSEKGLCGMEFPDGNGTLGYRAIRAQAPDRIRGWHATARKALSGALAGRVPKTLPPLDLSVGTDFQQRVWQTLRKIACGRTWSYSQVAQKIGRPGAVRAVGSACGANPIPVFIPCHRVLAANHRLGGFSAGLKWKRMLLGREGITFAS